MPPFPPRRLHSGRRRALPVTHPAPRTITGSAHTRRHPELVASKAGQSWHHQAATLEPYSMRAGTNQQGENGCQQYAARMECARSAALGMGRALAPVDFAPDEDPARCWARLGMQTLQASTGLRSLLPPLGGTSAATGALKSRSERSAAERRARSPGVGRVVRGEVARCATRRVGERMESPRPENW